MVIIDFLLKRLRFLKAYYKPVYGIMLTVFLFVSVLAFGAKHFQKAQNYEHLLKAQYSRAVSDISLMVDNIETNLSKSVIATNSAEISKIANRIYTDAAIARLTLGQLPSYGNTLSGISKYLTQVGDYTYNLSLEKINGTSLSQKEYDILKGFISETEALGKTLSKLSDEIYGNRVNILDINAQNSDEFKKNNPVFSSVAEESGQHFASLPSLIYDGPYSDHVKNKKSALLEGKENITRETAENTVKNLFGKNFKGKINFSGEKTGVLPTYSFTATVSKKEDRIIEVEVTKQGGAISLILDNRFVPETKVSIEAAKSTAYSFLSQYEFGDMEDTYHEISDNVLILNFASKQNNVLCYPDLVKVKVALDNSEILGIECSGYIANHRKRELPPFSHTDDEIKSKLSPKATPQKITKCIIPTESGGEIACYEILCKYNEKTFLIYLNAETLKEEDILILVETEYGSLTM